MIGETSDMVRIGDMEGRVTNTLEALFDGIDDIGYVSISGFVSDGWSCSIIVNCSGEECYYSGSAKTVYEAVQLATDEAKQSQAEQLAWNTWD